MISTPNNVKLLLLSSIVLFPPFILPYLVILVLFLTFSFCVGWSSFLLDKTIDVLLYVDRLDSYRVDTLDRQIIQAITYSFGKQIWNRAAVVLTHAQLSPPDGLSYEEFFTKRSEALLKVVHLGGGIRKQDSLVWHLHPFGFSLVHSSVCIVPLL